MFALIVLRLGVASSQGLWSAAKSFVTRATLYLLTGIAENIAEFHLSAISDGRLIGLIGTEQLTLDGGRPSWP